MKKFLSVFLIVVFILSLTGCGEKEVQSLYLLNWGDYINSEVLDAFTAETGIRVVMDEVDSNEAMYEKIKSGSTKYDIVIPSDYMIERLIQEELILKLDKSKLPALDGEMFEPAIYDLLADTPTADYAAPYFYGSLGIMYNEQFQEVVEEHGFKVFFDSSLTPEGTKIGMYNSSRDCVAAALLTLGYDVNTVDEHELAQAEALLKGMDYAVWGDDNLKNEIVAGNLDIALVYSGDYFDKLYIALEEEEEIDFHFLVPISTNLWFDAMVIPVSSRNHDAAYKFINFFLTEENAFNNVEYVGYTPTITAVYERMLEDEENWEDITGNVYFRDFYYTPGFQVQIYRHVSNEHYQVLEEIMMRAKAR